MKIRLIMHGALELGYYSLSIRFAGGTSNNMGGVIGRLWLIQMRG